MNSKEYINNICEEYGIENYTINDDGSLDVCDNVNLRSKNLKNFSRNLENCPLKFRNVTGYFIYNYDNLTSLQGSPVSVGSSFFCTHSKIKSLKKSPLSIGGNFYCEDNQIRSLEGFPENFGGTFYCFNNPIHTLVWDWINRANRDSMVEYFNDLDIIRDDGKTIILDRLEEFMDIYNVKIPLKEVENHYTII